MFIQIGRLKQGGRTLQSKIRGRRDHRVDEKKMEEIDKYHDLRIEIERLWNMKTMVVPISIK